MAGESYPATLSRARRSDRSRSSFSSACAPSCSATARSADARADCRWARAKAARAEAPAASSANPASVARRLRARPAPSRRPQPAPRPGTRAPRRSGRGPSRLPRPRTGRGGPRAAGTPGCDRRRPTPQRPRRAAGGEAGPRGALDPPPESVPLGEDRLVGDLHGRRPRHRLAVEGEQTVLAVTRKHLVERVGLELELAQLAATHPAPRVLRRGSTLTRRRNTWRHAACADGPSCA